MAADRTVLFLADESPYEWEWGPLATRLDRVFELHRGAGWSPAIATIRTSWSWHDELRRRGIAAYTLNVESYYATPLAAFRFAQIVRASRPTVVHALGPFCALISGLSRYLAPGPGRIYDRSHVAGATRLNLASRVAGMTSDHTMARSGAVGWSAETLDRTPADRITVVHDGIYESRAVSDEEKVQLRRDLGVEAGEPVVGMISRLRPEKGHDTLLRSVPLLREALGRRVHVVLVGAGPFESSVRELAEGLQLSDLHFVGHQPDIAPWLGIADVIAIPSYQDAFPKVCLEAFAASRPVVGSDVGGMPEAIQHGTNGILVPPGDHVALASALASVLSTPELADRLSLEGRHTYESRYTLAKRNARWVGVYERVAALRRGEKGS